MPPKKTAVTKTAEQPKEPVKRPTRAARNKRELSDEEPVVDAKKKKVADKVPSKVTTTAKMPAKRKQQTNTVGDDVEPAASLKQQATKRKRTAISKESKSVKLNKDVNDNELVNEENEQDNEDDKPMSQPAKTTTRGRTRKPAADNLTQEKPSAPVSKRGRAQSKKATEEQNLENDQPDEEESKQPINEPVRKGRGRKQATVVEEPLITEPIIEEPLIADAVTEEPKRRGGRVKKVIQEHVPELVESQPAAKKSARGKSKTEASRQCEEQLPEPTTKKAVRGKSKTKASKQDKDAFQSRPEEDSSTKSQKETESKTDDLEDNAKPATKRGRREVPRPDSKDEAEVQEKQIASKKTGKGKKPEVDQEEKEQVVEENVKEIQSEQPAVKRAGRGKTQKVATVNIEEKEAPVVAVGRRGRHAKKDDETHQEREETDEIVETHPQPITSTTEHPAKRGRKPSRKVVENIELQTYSQPVTSTTSIEPSTKKGRGRGKKTQMIEQVVEEKMQLDDDEDDNTSEKDLVIDLPEEPPKKQTRGKKTVTQPAEKVIEPQKTSESEPPIAPSKRAGRGKKQPETTLATTSTTNKRKTDDATSSSNEDLPKVQEIESIQEKHITPIDSEESTSKRPIKRGRLAATIVHPKPVEAASVPKAIEQKVDVQSSKEFVEKSVPQEAPTSREGDESIQSGSQDESIKQNEIDNVIEFMKSIVEKSVRQESSSFEQSKVVDEETSSSFNDSGEVIEAKELEETFAELPNISTSSDDLKLTYDSVAFKNNFSKTESTNLISFTNTELESNERKRAKLFDIRDRLNLVKISSGTIVAFGDNEIGELGIGKITNGKSLPTRIEASDEFCYVNTLSQHSACINSSGTLYTFGNNDECALGRLTNLNANSNREEQDSLTESNDEVEKIQRRQEQLESTPTICELSKSYRVFKATCGDSHTAALTTNGSVLYWGNFRDTNGSVGLSVDKLKASLEFEKIHSQFEIVDIASGGNFIILLDSSGRVYSMGTCDVGQLGRLTNEECKFDKQNRALFLKPHPVEFPKDVEIDAIWAGEFDAFARSTDNRLFAWGLNNYCQLGFKQDGSVSNEDQCVWKPKEVAYFTKLGHRIEKIACGQHHSIALDDHGNVFAFGRHEYGRLGLGKVGEDAETPKMIETFEGTKVVDISCGASSSFATTEGGKLYSWGMESRQLGQGKDPGDIFEPKVVNFKSIDNFKAIKVSAGSNHCLVLGQTARDDEINNNAVKNGL